MPKVFSGFPPSHTSWSYKSSYLQTWSKDVSRIMTVTLPLAYRHAFVCLGLAEVQAYLEIWVLAAAASLPASAKIAKTSPAGSQGIYCKSASS